MQQIKPILHSFVVIFLILVVSSMKAETEPLRNRWKSEAKDAIQKAGLPALGVSISKYNFPLFNWVSGHRSLQHEAKATLKDRWHLGSDTKAMTAFLVAIASEEGLLSYEDLVVEVLNLKKFHLGYSEVKVKDFLSHSSPLNSLQSVDGGELWKSFFKSEEDVSVQREKIVTALFQQRPVDNSKKSFRYLNSNYVVIGRILEKLYQKSWEVLVKEKLFTPLEMNQCGFGVAGAIEEVSPSEPWAHLQQKDELIALPPKLNPDNPAMLGPAGTVHCSLGDWQIFLTEVLKTWQGEGRLLPQSDRNSPYFQSPSKDYPYTYGGWGVGFNKEGQRVFQHSGSNTFNFALAFLNPQEELIVQLVTNSAHAEAKASVQELFEYILSSLD